MHSDAKVKLALTMPHRVLDFAIVTALTFSSAAVSAQSPVDSALLRYIDGIRAIDAHAHPMLPVAPGAKPDTDYDALPLGGIPAFDVPSRLRPEHAIWRQAQQALYGIAPGEHGDAYHQHLKQAVADSERAKGSGFPAWALDQANVDVMLANRVALGAGLDEPRFRWIAFADPLMLPLDTRGEASRTPDTRDLYPRERKLLARYLAELKLAAIPSTLAEYERAVVVPTIARWRRAGAVGIKFEAAYLRPLDFDVADAAAAARTYARYARGGVPSRAEYKNLEDHLFRVIVREAGRQRLATQIHVLEQFGGFYSPSGAAPHLLESVANDSTLRGAKIVIVHGGWPLVGETMALLAKPNVYADVSMIDDMLSPDELAGVLRIWLTEWPEKVLFGSDAFDGGAEEGWEQVAWVGSHTARQALAIALTAMMREGEIDRPRAEEIARMVMRENALEIYDLSPRR